MATGRAAAAAPACLKQHPKTPESTFGGRLNVDEADLFTTIHEYSTEMQWPDVG